MAKQTINIGSGELAGNGESIRSAFSKINDNFDEIYAGGIGGGGSGYTGSQGDVGYTGSSGDVGFTGSQGDVGFTGSSGDIGFTGSQGDIGYTGSSGDIGFTGSQGDVGYSGSVGATPDFSAVAEHIIPAADLTYDLGTTSSQWRSLYVGTSTIYLGGTALSVTSGTLTLDGNPVSVSTLVNGTSTVTLSSNGALTFPDGTVQTTAYIPDAGAPLFVVVNTDGTTSWSTDGTTWSTPVTLVFNGNPDVSRVAVADSYITYICDNQDTDFDNQLWYATTYGIEPTLVTSLPATGTSYYEWSDIQHGGNYTVAVGAYYEDDGIGGFQDPVPVWAYTTNGSAWTLGGVDPGYQTAFPLSQFASVDYDGTGWLFVNESQGGNGGAFYLTDLTGELGIDNYIDFDNNGLGTFPNIESVVWTGNRWWLKDAETPADYFVSDGANPLTATWSAINVEAISLDSGFGTTGYFEDAGGEIDGTYWFAATNGAGQVIASSDGGDTWTVSVPLPHTGTIDTATEATTCVVTFNSNSPNNDSEQIVVTNASPSNYNGTYFVIGAGGGNWELYTDVELATPVDSTLFGTFVSADVEFTSGMYIDSFGFGLGKFLAGNDDEQLFTSTDLTTWTKVDDQDNAFDYWNDIDFNATWGASGAAVSTGDITFDGIKIIGAGTASGDGYNAGTIELVPDNSLYSNDQYLIIEPTVPNHIHIRAGGTQDDSNASLILGGENTNITVEDFNNAVTINTGDGVDSYVWEFADDGTTYLAKNSSSPTSYLQTPRNDDTIELYLGAGNGVTISANDYSGGDVQWNFDTDGTLTFPDDTVQTTAYPGVTIASPAQGTFPVGEATAITVTNSPNLNWTSTGLFANGINFVFTVDGSGNATVSTINDGGTGHFVGETFTVVGTAIGLLSPADDVNFEVTAINTGSVTALDLTKQTQILTAVGAAGAYSLADGVEGQIMYFVPSSGVNDGIYVNIANARIMGEGPVDQADYSWTPFTGETLAPTTIAMAIFADGAWCLRGGDTD